MEASILEKIKLYRDVYFRLFKKETRSTEKVDEDYDKGIYQKYVNAEIWSKNKNDISILGFLNPEQLEQNKNSFYKYENRILKDNYVNIWKTWEKEFVNSMRRFVDDEEIVELGCGYGRNLFALRRNNFKNPISGFDISKNAVYVGQKLNEKFNANINFQVLDITKELVKEEIKNKTVFTYTALEQTKYQLEIILDNLINGKPKQVIHFETIPELLSLGIFGTTVRINRYRKDYQTRLLSILKKQKEMIKITNLEKVKTCPSVFNPVMMVRYEIL